MAQAKKATDKPAAKTPARKTASSKTAKSAKPAVTRAASARSTKTVKPAATKPVKPAKPAAASKATKPAAKAKTAPKAAASKTPSPKSTAAKPAAAKPAAAKPAAAKPAPAKAKAAAPAAKPAKSAAQSNKAKMEAAAARVAKPAEKKSAAPKASAKPVKKARILVGASSNASGVRVATAAVKPMAPRKTAPVGAPSAPAPQSKKPVGQRHGFKLHEHVVYPAHGVGQIVAIEEQEIAGMTLELFVIAFEKDKMTLRVPTSKLEGLRKLADEAPLAKALETLKGRARIKRTMWSRRAQEYEAKINSGELIAIAEVVRDLYRSENQPEQSYSERQLYEQALDRMARELAAVEGLDDRGAVQKITDILAKSAKGRREAQALAEAEADDSDDASEAA